MSDPTVRLDQRHHAEAVEAATDGISPPHPELRRLEPLIGTWRTREHTDDTTALGPGVPVTSTETFSWLEGNYFLVQTYETAFGDEPPQKGINYWGYDGDAGCLRIIFFSNNGPFTEDGSRYQVTVGDDVLTGVGPARFQYALDDDGRIAVNAEGTIAVAWWIRGDAGEWEPWMTNTFTRIS